LNPSPFTKINSYPTQTSNRTSTHHTSKTAYQH